MASCIQSNLNFQLFIINSKSTLNCGAIKHSLVVRSNQKVCGSSIRILWAQEEGLVLPAESHELPNEIIREIKLLLMNERWSEVFDILIIHSSLHLHSSGTGWQCEYCAQKLKLDPSSGVNCGTSFISELQINWTWTGYWWSADQNMGF